MAFARAMDYAIDKEEFFQLSSSTPPAPSLSSDDHHGPGPHSSDFFDEFVVMEVEGAQAPSTSSAYSPGNSFTFPHHGGDELTQLDHHPHVSDHDHHGQHFDLDLGHHGLDGEGDGLSPPASTSSAAAPISITSDDRSVDMMSVATSIPSVSSSSASNNHKSLSLSTADLIQRQRQQRQIGAGQQQIPPGFPGADATNHVVLGHLNPETLEQRRRLLGGRRGQVQPAGGSISDSELLRLEGLSVSRVQSQSREAHRGLVQSVEQDRFKVPSSSENLSSITSATSTPPVPTHGLPINNNNSSRSFHPPGGRTPLPTTTADDIDLCNLTKTGSRHNFKSGSKKFESIYHTIRRAVGGHNSSRGRIALQQQQQEQQQEQQEQQQKQQQPQQHPATAPIPQTMIPSHMESAQKATRRLASESQLMWDGMPISPPLTDMPHLSHTHHSQTPNDDTAAFVAGLMDDPFFDPSVSFANHHHQHHQAHEGMLAPAAHINAKNAAYNANIPTTPLATPKFKTEAAGDDGGHYFPTTSETWSLDGANFVTSSDMSNSFMPGDGVDPWSFQPSSDSGNFGANHHSSRNHHNLTIQVPRYAAFTHDQRHTPTSDDLAGSGLMIHMPQPRTPNTAPLLSSHIHQTHNGMALHEAPSMYPFPGTDGAGTPHGMHHSFHGAGGPPYTEHTGLGNHPSSRRPKPRAPSSGARYHQLGLSPRKARQPSICSSSSPSPTPGGGPPAPPTGGSRRSRSASRRQSSISFGAGAGGGSNSNNNNNNVLAHRKSTTDLIGVVPSSDMQSHAIRKRRSASSWRGPSSGGGGGSRRSGSGASSSASAAAAMEAGVGGISLDGGGGGGGIGFVNYTPSDHTVLMTGVAPSGSSKTKMRREKEAQEAQRRLSEAVVKAVTAAGVDVSMLQEEGLVI